MIYAIIIVLLALTFGVEIIRVVYRRDVSYSEAVKGLQAALTALALLLAGFWYFFDRKGSPHADLEVVTNVLPAGKKRSYATLEVAVSVKNLGETLLRINHVDLRLQDASLSDSEAVQLSALGREEWPPQYASGQLMFNEAELQWPIIKRFKGELKHEVEPGETDVITATFIVPCSVSRARIAVSVRKAQSGSFFWRSPQLDWKRRAFAEITPACHEEKSVD